MTYILHDYIHDIVEDYIYELIVKTKICVIYLKDLCNILDQLLEYNVKLNPKKYVFGVLSRKLLGFIISKRGVEMDPNKFKAINHIPPPHNLNQLKSFEEKI